MLLEQEPTLELVHRIASTGIQALTVHCRTKDMRPREPAMWHRLNDIVNLVTNIPVTLNGDIFAYETRAKAIAATGCSSVMTARGAQENASLFRKDGKLEVMEVAKAYIKKAIEVNNSIPNTKYTLMQMGFETRTEAYQRLTRAKTYKDLCELFGLADYYQDEAVRIFEA
ncbi:tRNA-dihydrouridine synthase 2, partial [Spiromyces aspiralis]